MTRCEISEIDTLVDDDLGCKKIGYTHIPSACCITVLHYICSWTLCELPTSSRSFTTSMHSELEL